ncbi:MAG: PorP/SprF family type IX secretion system membrane protein [Crocinitomicaceae bacterium]|tara:strand:- start:338 stop:1972 length:1635 start_codon:yes stop_codon:yes gene_type:complete
MKNSILALVFMSLAYGFNAQQLPMYSQFFWNDFVINPAYTGVTNTNRVQLGYRNQWSGFNGAPSTYTLGGHTLLKNKKMGLGGMLFMDDTGGAVQQMGLMLNYNYILKLNESSSLAMAVSGVINQYSYDGSSIQNIDPDPTLSGSNKQLAPDMSFGLLYSMNDKLRIGLGINQLIQSRLSKLDDLGTLNLGENRLIRHYNLSTSYSFEISEKFDLDPYFLLRSTFINAPQFEIGAKGTMNEQFFFGLSYRHTESVIAMLGINFKNTVLAYSYDYSTTDIGSYSNGSHEVLLAYQFNRPEMIVEPKKEEKPDRDGDGILDKDDLCPDVKGLVEFKGCPDTDGDGLFDKIDDCPKTFGPKENNGCPYPDTDKDGLLDKDDDCPSIAGPLENNGCPYKDTDGDGLLDKDDECPQTPGPIENKGCPIIEKEEQEVLNTAFSNLEFETGLDVIKKASKPSLMELANTLKKKPDWKIQVTGHTDNVGDDDVNMVLSKKRAEAVKNFLGTEGIDKRRVKTLYFGETKPLSDNNTPSGRQKNRRVEFKIIFD